mgnify:CR=1 FL=1
MDGLSEQGRHMGGIVEAEHREGFRLRALQQVHPFGLDLSSGLESSPGLKDPAKLSALFQTLSLKGRRPCLTS